jgi:cytochrome P450
VFGIRTKTVDADYMERLYALMEKWSVVMELGATPPVDSFPLLKWVPERLLGNWGKRAREVGSLMKSLYSDVLCQVEGRREQGINRNSFMDRVLDQQSKNQLTRMELYFLGGVLMEGGSDTSSSLILAIVLAMMAYPQVQER